MKAVNLAKGKKDSAELAQSNAVLSGATAGSAHHKDRIIELRKERARLDAEEKLLMAELEPEQVSLEERLRDLKRPRCPRGRECKSDCVLDHDDDDDAEEDEPVPTRVKGKERQ